MVSIEYASNGLIDRLPGGNHNWNNRERINCCRYEGDCVNLVGSQNSRLSEAETEGSPVEEDGQPPVDGPVTCSLSSQQLSTSQHVIFCPTLASHIRGVEVIVLV